MPAITATTVRKRNRLGIGRISERVSVRGLAGKLTNEIIQHVRRFVARVLWRGPLRGRIGGQRMPPLAADRARPIRARQMPDAALPIQASPEADILSALGTRSIVLVGMMGGGKSTIGRRMALRLKLPFVDVGPEIEAAAGMTIPEIFERHGEPHFRDGEARVIARLLDGGPIVLATGGGAFMREETRTRIAAKAISIWLKADVDVIMRRVRRRADRPLLQTADPVGTVTRLLTEREPIYGHADLTIWSRDVPHDKIVDECIEALHTRLCAQPQSAADPTELGTTQAMGALR